ncbi:MAG: TIGR03619 family F420-dependent LLM class oxidoreductase [SAR324 cluster bacterium]|nr:TIGR03619 family F420-dependent LLM class oxidoreductase [SAR324 cluster bacterium]
MKFGISLFNRGPLARPAHLTAQARRAEALGFDTIAISDHIVIPKVKTGNYPYHPEGEFPLEMSYDYFEPLATLMYILGATSSIKLGTSVLVVPYRNPILVAKMTASVDALSGGRIFLGVGTGWWREEFEALGIGDHFEDRGARTDEYIRIFRNLWSEENPQFNGKFYQYGNIEFSPKPAQKPGIPIWIGGHTKRALRRTAELGDVWHPIGLRPPAGLDPGELARKRDELFAMTEKAGRDPASIQIAFRAPLVFSDKERNPLVGSADQIVEDIKTYEAHGVDHLTCDFMVTSFDQAMDNLERVGKEILPQVT